ncbi:MAG: heavy-metal-associated domain-containing protein [Chromatiales bacterium]|nr:heavy-metal-associated domain-containing protein [Chromatiales bacterium]
MLELQVENIKCAGCANTIRKAVGEDDRVRGVDVDIDNQIVRVDAEEDAREQAVATLARLGYPLAGSVKGLSSAGAKARSFVSCAIGRIND